MPQSPHHTLLTLPFVPVLLRHPPTIVSLLGSETQTVPLKTPVASCLDGPRFPLLSADGNLLTSVHFESIGHEALGEDLQAYLGDLR